VLGCLENYNEPSGGFLRQLHKKCSLDHSHISFYLLLVLLVSACVCGELTDTFITRKKGLPYFVASAFYSLSTCGLFPWIKRSGR
jgi:hypothetical protein